MALINLVAITTSIRAAAPVLVLLAKPCCLASVLRCYLLIVEPLILSILPLLDLFILEVGHWQDVLEQVVEQDQRVELQVRVVAVVSLEGFPDALDDELGDVQAIMAYEVDLH